MKKMKLGVAIPCYKNHIPLLKRCLDSIEAQTCHPDLVVVHCSSSEENDIPLFSYTFQLRIITIPFKLNAAQNRNCAAAVLCDEGCTFLSFFDADDEMHPQRLEAIQYAVTQYRETKFIVHSFHIVNENQHPSFIKYDIFDIRYNQLVDLDHINGIGIQGHPDCIVAHGHVSVSKDVFEAIGFPEALYFSKEGEMGGIEDSIFCRNAIRMEGCKTVYLTDQLSKYYC